MEAKEMKPMSNGTLVLELMNKSQELARTDGGNFVLMALGRERVPIDPLQRQYVEGLYAEVYRRLMTDG